MNKYHQTTAVITGAGSGIGRALALELASRGANLALSDVDKSGLSDTATLVGSHGIKVHTHLLDVSDKTAMHDYAELVQAEFGVINLVINNAGVALNTGTLEQTDLEEFEWLMSINFFGVLYGTKTFLPYLQQANWGHIVNISSLFGLIGVPGQAAYNSSKFAVRGLSEALRQELDAVESSVSCTSVHPGGVKTNIVRNSRSSTHTANDSLFISTAEEFDKLARTTPESAAKQILKAVDNNKRRLLIGLDAKLLDWIQRIFPNGYQRIFLMLAGLLQR